MKKKEKVEALKELARVNPYIEHVGFLWKNPFNPRSKGIRWRRNDLDLFRKFQIEYR